MIYQFNQITLDTAQYRLSLSGNPVAVEPQVFDLLVYLVEHKDRVVTRGELLENLWKGKVVSDSALGARLKDVRKAVGDSGKKQEVIKTIHGRGYQFITPIKESKPGSFSEKVYSSTQQEISADRAPAVAAGLPVPALTEKPSIVVLPFIYLGTESDDKYFAAGLTEDIIANLCRYRELFVIDHHSASAYRDGITDTEQFASELGVEYVTKGNIRRSGDQIRISAQLIEAATGKTMWADHLDRKFDELFTLEDEVAAKVASSLVSHIESESIARAVRKHPENMTAFDCFIRARPKIHSYDPHQIALARPLLEQAIELDPDYATAYAYIAFSFSIESESPWGISRHEAIESAATYARKALSLDDFDSDAHAAMGEVYMMQRKFELAEAHVDRAIECNPNDYNAFCVKSWLLSFVGRASEVMVCGANALHLNPLAPDYCLLAIITAHYTESRYDAALEMLARVQEPDENSEAWRAACLAQLGRDAEAHVAAANAIEMGGNFIRGPDWLDIWAFKNPQDLNHFIDGLNKSGVLCYSSEKMEKI